MTHWTENPETYRRNLPHFTPANAAFFVTFRLHDSLPKSVFEKLQAEQRRVAAAARSMSLSKEESINMQKRHFANFDRMLDSAEGPRLALSSIQIINDIIHAIASEGHIRLWCFTIMSNHVHILFSLGDTGKSMRQVMQLIKGRSAFECNKALGKTGTFWQHESYDHVVRDGEFERIIQYILMNPVKAGLVVHWQDYQWTYLHPDCNVM